MYPNLANVTSANERFSQLIRQDAFNHFVLSMFMIALETRGWTLTEDHDTPDIFTLLKVGYPHSSLTILDAVVAEFEGVFND